MFNSFDLRHQVKSPNSICISEPFFRPHQGEGQGIRTLNPQIYQQSALVMHFAINMPVFFTYHRGMPAFDFTLPIDDALPALLDAMRETNQCVLQAPPGAGKTTRVPIALEQAGLFKGKILMLEPRRLAARAAAARLAQHYGDDLGQTVGYRMRGDSKASKKTKIEVVTEGILTRMIQSDPELSGIDCIIFDEFHERSLNADLGLAFCLEIRAALREDLAILVMSATLDAAPVAALMGDAPIVTSEGRSFDVTPIHLPRPWAKPNQRGPRFSDAMADLIVHAASDAEGSILAFLPGEGEIKQVQSILTKRLDGIEIYPLYGAMPFADQRRAIAPSDGRKIVLATSIAETSLTIEDIRIVVDGGQARRARFDAGSGMSRLITEKVTKAEATQRMGRAGRVSEGICYKLWTKGEEGGLRPFAPPEILSSDLTPLVMELAAWGVDSPVALPFLTQPREADFQSAQALLMELGALDSARRITNLGERIAREPTHPRLAKVLLSAGGDANIAVAVMEARDILVRPAPLDFALRVKAAKNPQDFKHDHPYAINTGARARVMENAKKLRAKGRNEYSLAQMAALAYPDRIGLHRAGDAPRFLLSGGKGAVVDATDPLASQRMIVAIDLDGDAKEAKLRLGISISEAEITEIYADRIQDVKFCEWSKREAKVIAVEQRQLGALVLAQNSWKDCDLDAMAAAMLDGIKDLGLAVLPWPKPAKLLLGRINKLVTDGADLPDCSDDALLERIDDWLLPHLGGLRSKADLSKLDMTAITNALLSWDENERLNKLTPPFIIAPTGTKMMVDYSGDQPKIAVRLQELFGMTVHPTIGPKRTPVLIDLLSPAQRTVQTTADLPNFWKTSYADVRKDMRGRYPRHPWPEDPTQAEPTRRVKNPRKR
jgi:ATP-dependent helicase HrpB